MGKWQNKLELKDLWKAREEKKISVSELAREIAKRIRTLPCYDDYDLELEDISTEFETIDNNVDDFDNVLERLYDWADTPLPTPRGEWQRRLCWVSTVI